MPINVFGKNSSSHDNGNKFDTTLINQKPYLRTKYIEKHIDIDKTNQLRIKNLPNLIRIREPASELNDDKFNDISIARNTARVYFKDKNLDNVRFLKLKTLSQQWRACYSKRLCRKKY